MLWLWLFCQPMVITEACEKVKFTIFWSYDILLKTTDMAAIPLRDGQLAPIWSRLQFDPQSFEAPAPALIKKRRA